ncbi:MAG TPA: M23 family metallopeptidase [Gaiellaceae bacterium]|nr:M23 family metallopeptidase [Gaiellaceae bacterium]
MRAEYALRNVMRVLVLSAACAAGLAVAGSASAYGWPVKPFDKPHPIRSAFDDPRFHLGAEGSLSAFHFGVDIAAKDGTAVYAVAAGWVTAHAADVTVTSRSGRGFGYWHIRPVVRTHQRVRRHQLLGYVRRGWGHVHFAESIDREYRNPLRRGALTPFYDKTVPTVASVSLVSPEGGGAVDPRRVTGTVDAEAEIFDTPPVAPRAPWNVARLTPAIVWARLLRNDQPLGDWSVVVDFHFALMPASLYGYVYAPGTYQNKANRPGKYLFWIAHDLDTTTLPNGRYTIEVLAADTRWNMGVNSVSFTVANPQQATPPQLAPGVVTPSGHAE